MHRRNMVYPALWLASGLALVIAIVTVIGFARHPSKVPSAGADGVPVVAGAPSVSSAAPPTGPSAPTPGTAPAVPEAPRSDAKRYGEPAMGPDALLDGPLAEAPDAIGVRHRLFAMQWPGGRDIAAERTWQARLTSLADGRADHIRVRCSSTTCEIATDDPDLAPRLSIVTGAQADDRAAPCPLAAPDGAEAAWTRAGIAVVYVPRNAC